MTQTREQSRRSRALYRERHPEREAATQAKKDANGQSASLRWYYRNRERSIERNRAWKKADPERAALTMRKTKLKKAGVDISNLPAKPDGCTICGSNKKLCIDHCHATLKVRGWLCDNCNVSLGRAKDNPATLRALADYLERK